MLVRVKYSQNEKLKVPSDVEGEMVEIVREIVYGEMVMTNEEWLKIKRKKGVKVVSFAEYVKPVLEIKDHG